MDWESTIRNRETYVDEIGEIEDLSLIVQEIDGRIENAWKVFDGILNWHSASRATHAANTHHRLRRRGLLVVNNRCIFWSLLCCRRRSFSPRELQHFDRDWEKNGESWSSFWWNCEAFLFAIQKVKRNAHKAMAYQLFWPFVL